MNAPLLIVFFLLFIKSFKTEGNPNDYDQDLPAEPAIETPHICFQSILDESQQFGLQMQNPFESPPPLLVAEAEVNIVKIGQKQIDQKAQFYLKKIKEKCTRTMVVSNKNHTFDEIHTRVKFHTGDKSIPFTTFHLIFYPNSDQKITIFKDFNNIASLLAVFKTDQEFILKELHYPNLPSQSSLALFVVYSINPSDYIVKCMCLIIKNTKFIVVPRWPVDRHHIRRWVTVTAEVLEGSRTIYEEKWVAWPCKCKDSRLRKLRRIFIDEPLDARKVEFYLDFLSTTAQSPNTTFEEIKKRRIPIHFEFFTVKVIESEDMVLNDQDNIYLVKSTSFSRRCPDSSSLVVVKHNESQQVLQMYQVFADRPKSGYLQYVNMQKSDTNFCPLYPN